MFGIQGLFHLEGIDGDNYKKDLMVDYPNGHSNELWRSQIINPQIICYSLEAI